MTAAAPKRLSEDNVGGAKKEKKFCETELETQLGWEVYESIHQILPVYRYAELHQSWHRDE